MCTVYAMFTAVFMVSLVFCIVLFLVSVALFKRYYLKDESDENQ